jgi:hypothetical protein
MRILVDQAAQDGFSEDPFTVEVGNGEVATVGDALADALVRPGRVVAAPRGAVLYRPHSGQGREEMSLDLMADPRSER